MKIETDLQVQLQAPAQLLCEDFARESFAPKVDSTVHQIRARLAASMANDPEQEQRFRDCLEGGFVPGGGLTGEAGSELDASMVDCLVQEVGDTITGKDRNGVVGIFDALGKATEVLRRGVCVAYDFSRVRPRGAPVKGSSSRANGPVAYMKIFDTVGMTIAQAGSRRGTQMGVLRVDHPDIELFVEAKTRSGAESLSGFKIAVALTDEFMQAVGDDDDFDLVHQEPPASAGLARKTRGDGTVVHVHRTVRARDIWERIVRSAYEGAELGCVFIDRANEGNNLRYVESIEATSPSGAQCLPPNGCSVHGNLMLSRFVSNPYTASASFDWAALQEVIDPAVEFLDQVLDKTIWPSPEHQVEAQTKRRIGLGYLEFADALAMMGIRYDSPMAARFATQLGAFVRDMAYRASIRLAVRMGPFALFNADKFLEDGTFASRLPQCVQDAIGALGIRNSHLLSIAPSSTAAQAFGDNASAYIAPIIARLKGDTLNCVGVGVGFSHLMESETESSVSLTAEHPTLDAQLAMAGAAARSVDASSSLTVRAPEDCSLDDFAVIYQKAWRLGLKGVSAVRSTTTSDTTAARSDRLAVAGGDSTGHFFLNTPTR